MTRDDGLTSRRTIKPLGGETSSLNTGASDDEDNGEALWQDGQDGRRVSNPFAGTPVDPPIGRTYQRQVRFSTDIDRTERSSGETSRYPTRGQSRNSRDL